MYKIDQNILICVRGSEKIAFFGDKVILVACRPSGPAEGLKMGMVWLRDRE